MTASCGVSGDVSGGPVSLDWKTTALAPIAPLSSFLVGFLFLLSLALFTVGL